jgi:hypothetical protein
METIEISGVLGMIAAVVLTLNICMGILMSTNYRKLPIWKKIPQKYQILKMVDLHEYTSYAVLFIVFLHIQRQPFEGGIVRQLSEQRFFVRYQNSELFIYCLSFVLSVSFFFLKIQTFCIQFLR